jgi:hypothetical protein
LRHGGLLLAALVVLFAGCESTQDKSARLEREGAGALTEQRGVVVSRQSDVVDVLSTQVLQDEHGTAAVVTLRNTGKQALAQVPISIDARARSGKSVFRNDDAGLEPALVRVPLLRPQQVFTWVHDQIAAAARPRAVRAKVGQARAVRSEPPRVTVTAPRLEHDPVSGVAAVGFVANRSHVDQRKLVIFAVARKGRRVVAAGRAQINRLKARKRARYTIFFIGDPRGARISLEAPPTRLDIPERAPQA